MKSCEKINTRKFCGLFSKLHHLARNKQMQFLWSRFGIVQWLDSEHMKALSNLLLIVPKNLMDYVISAMHHCILTESPIYSVDTIILLYFFLYCTVFKLVWPWTSLLLFCVVVSFDHVARKQRHCARKENRGNLLLWY